MNWLIVFYFLVLGCEQLHRVFHLYSYIPQMAEGKLVEELPVPCSVDSHNDTVLKSKPYLCPICTHHSLSCAGLMLHLTTEHNEHLNAVCKLCRQVFPSDKIADHVTRCKGVHACPFCRATFARPTYLQRHIVRRHHNTSLAYRPSCDVCEKTFSSTSALNIHKRVHNGKCLVPYIPLTLFVTHRRLTTFMWFMRS